MRLLGWLLKSRFEANLFLDKRTGRVIDKHTRANSILKLGAGQ